MTDNVAGGQKDWVGYDQGMDWLPVVLIVFFAIFTQSLTGFGLALVSMPLLTALLGVETAAPMVALFGLLAEVILLLYYRQAVNVQVIWRLIAASMIGVPAGVLVVRSLNEEVVLAILGVIVGGYALYALLKLRLPAIDGPAWAYGVGFVAGVLGGAYNTSGPPVIVYGNCRGWPPEEFKANLQGFFLLTSLIIAASHALAGNYSAEVLRYSLLALPAVAVGLAAGLALSKRVSATTFRTLVLWLLLALGAWLIFS
jgi:uncharacterized membrane protein YfcA